MMKGQSGYIGAIVAAGVVLFILIAGSAYYLGRLSVKPKATPLPSSIVYTSQTTPSPLPSPSNPDPTQGWQSYWDPDSTLSFKYPSYWDKSTNGNRVSLKKVYDPNCAPQPCEEGLDVTVYKGNGNLTAKEFLQQIYYGTYPDNSLTQAWINSDTIEPINLNRIKAEKIDDLAEGYGSDGWGVWIRSLNDGIFLRFDPYKIDTEQKIYDPLLSTVQFVTP